MDFKDMTVDELEERKAAIPGELDNEGADLDALEEEVRNINAELETRKEAEAKRVEIREEVAKGAGKVEATIEDNTEANKMDVNEVRASKEYKDAYGELIKKNYDVNKLNEEMRALLTTNAAEDGMIAVPTGVDDKIRTAWENDEIMSRITRTFFKGNLKVGYEASASGATVHAEGGDAVEPEELVIAYTELIPAMIKKVVEVSDEVLAINSTLVDYLYDEIEYQIVKLAAGAAVNAIVDSSLSASYDIAGATPTTADIVQAAGKLSGEATNPVIITTRSTAANIKAAALSAHYGYDPFDGMPVLYTNDAALDGASFVIADLSAVQANFPEGDGAKFKFDELTKADADIVRIIGRLYAAIAVVAPGRTVVAGVGSES